MHLVTSEIHIQENTEWVINNILVVDNLETANIERVQLAVLGYDLNESLQKMV